MLSPQQPVQSRWSDAFGISGTSFKFTADIHCIARLDSFPEERAEARLVRARAPRRGAGLRLLRRLVRRPVMRRMSRRGPRDSDVEARHHALLDLAVHQPLDRGEQRPFLGADQRYCLALDAGAASAADA